MSSVCACAAARCARDVITARMSQPGSGNCRRTWRLHSIAYSYVSIASPSTWDQLILKSRIVPKLFLTLCFPCRPRGLRTGFGCGRWPSSTASSAAPLTGRGGTRWAVVGWELVTWPNSDPWWGSQQTCDIVMCSSKQSIFIFRYIKVRNQFNQLFKIQSGQLMMFYCLFLFNCIFKINYHLNIFH